MTKTILDIYAQPLRLIQRGYWYFKSLDPRLEIGGDSLEVALKQLKNHFGLDCFRQSIPLLGFSLLDLIDLLHEQHNDDFTFGSDIEIFYLTEMNGTIDDLDKLYKLQPLERDRKIYLLCCFLGDFQYLQNVPTNLWEQSIADPLSVTLFAKSFNRYSWPFNLSNAQLDRPFEWPELSNSSLMYRELTSKVSNARSLAQYCYPHRDVLSKMKRAASRYHTISLVTTPEVRHDSHLTVQPPSEQGSKRGCKK